MLCPACLQDPAKRHTLDRKQVTEVLCALCDMRQPVAAACSSCGVSFGRYACLKCNFFDDTVSKQQFHCDDCGICRVGGRSNFFHCSTCNCCYSISLRGSHVCVSNSMHQNCPVCCEFLFDSIRPIAVLPCGHTIHQVRGETGAVGACWSWAVSLGLVACRRTPVCACLCTQGGVSDQCIMQLQSPFTKLAESCISCTHMLVCTRLLVAVSNF